MRFTAKKVYNNAVLPQSEKLLRNVATKIDSCHVDAEYAHLLADPGITVDKDGGLTIDASKVQNKAVICEMSGRQHLLA